MYIKSRYEGTQLVETYDRQRERVLDIWAYIRGIINALF